MCYAAPHKIAHSAAEVLKRGRPSNATLNEYVWRYDETAFYKMIYTTTAINNGERFPDYVLRAHCIATTRGLSTDWWRIIINEKKLGELRRKISDTISSRILRPVLRTPRRKGSRFGIWFLLIKFNKIALMAPPSTSSSARSTRLRASNLGRAATTKIYHRIRNVKNAERSEEEKKNETRRKKKRRGRRGRTARQLRVVEGRDVDP